MNRPLWATVSVLFGAFSIIGGLATIPSVPAHPSRQTSSVLATARVPLKQPAKPVSTSAVHERASKPLVLPPLTFGEHPQLVQTVKISYDMQVVAACLILEAGGEGEKGMQAVMNVISNRAGGVLKYFLKEVTWKGQFVSMNGTWSKGASGAAKAIAKASKHPSWNKACRFVEQAARGELSDITAGALYFYADDGKHRSWARELDEVAKIGHQIFLVPENSKSDWLANKARTYRKEFAQDGPTLARD